MNLFLVFLGGLSVITGAYGLYLDGSSLFLTLAVAWGGFLMGYQLKEDV
jgi:hypothetical protein